MVVGTAVLFVFMSMSAFLTCTATDPTVYVRGYVKDYEGNPAAYTQVVIVNEYFNNEEHTFTTETDAWGYYNEYIGTDLEVGHDISVTPVPDAYHDVCAMIHTIGINDITTGYFYMWFKFVPIQIDGVFVDCNMGYSYMENFDDGQFYDCFQHNPPIKDYAVATHDGIKVDIEHYWWEANEPTGQTIHGYYWVDDEEYEATVNLYTKVFQCKHDSTDPDGSEGDTGGEFLTLHSVLNQETDTVYDSLTMQFDQSNDNTADPPYSAYVMEDHMYGIGTYTQEYRYINPFGGEPGQVYFKFYMRNCYYYQLNTHDGNGEYTIGVDNGWVWNPNGAPNEGNYNDHYFWAKVTLT